ncbi:MAG: LysR family transcriptional regulator [Propionibacteriaceae bacterium]
MDVAQLILLRELAERGSVTEVAHATGRTPSAVSQQLKVLQRATGVALVERVGRGVRLTDAGHALARSAVDVQAALARAEATWQSYRGEPTGTVRLACFYSAAELLLPGLLTRLQSHPGINLAVTDQDVRQDAFAALTADHDVVIGHRSDDVLPPQRESLVVHPLLGEPVDVGLPLDHPLADRESVQPDEVVDGPWIGVPEGFPLDRMLSALAAQAGRPPEVVLRTTHLPLTERLVAAGHGLALLPRHTSAARAAGHFRLVPLAGFRAGRHVEALLRPDHAERRVVQIVLGALADEAARWN